MTSQMMYYASDKGGDGEVVFRSLADNMEQAWRKFAKQTGSSVYHVKHYYDMYREEVALPRVGFERSVRRVTG